MPCADLCSHISFSPNCLNSKKFERSTRTEEKYVETFFQSAKKERKKYSGE